ncbi:mycofactocin-coupled SDR family oxidoreductase [Agromyces archimandritae]|uniref:Mycofactocin-coupled SDR family oxidoreductase n=1 Tax=Agromyces archimandritae TaxID=2781962 RepID=A0A975IPK7_9MICO|nr:mycofactocin-coupled SDR family oxidoreductase [Agromyces archimandritae]QTX05738.1 mycofactocin-coupled SDR family oxidoreductase [Agromyces archimandritae]
MGRLEGKVALVSGAARGQGRSHALRLAEEGADIIAFDICEAIPENSYPPATEADLAETVRLVEALDRRIVAEKADVRDAAQVTALVDRGVAELGRLDVVSANAGIGGAFNRSEDIPDDEFMNMVNINLTGVWRTAKAAIPHLKAGGNGGAVILTSSDAGLFPYENISHYVSAKHGVIGLMRTLALELAPDMIRVNAICPTTVNTPMVNNEGTFKLFRPDVENPTVDDFKQAATTMNALPIPWVEAVDISNALVFLASDEARYITGVALPVDAGAAIK